MGNTNANANGAEAAAVMMPGTVVVDDAWHEARLRLREAGMLTGASRVDAATGAVTPRVGESLTRDKAPRGEELSVTGTCYCGAVRVATTAAAPLGKGCCSCWDCRRAHAAPLYTVAFVRPSEFFVLQGAELVRSSPPKPTSAHGDGGVGAPATPPRTRRFFCGRCGSRVCSTFVPPGADASNATLVGMYHGMMDDVAVAASEAWNPLDDKAGSFFLAEQPLPQLATWLRESPMSQGP